jgi:hypothetical protein
MCSRGIDRESGRNYIFTNMCGELPFDKFYLPLFEWKACKSEPTEYDETFLERRQGVYIYRNQSW